MAYTLLSMIFILPYPDFKKWLELTPQCVMMNARSYLHVRSSNLFTA